MAGSPEATFEFMIRLENVKIYRYSLTSLAAFTLGDECPLFSLPLKGELLGFGITAPGSTDLSLVLYQASGHYTLDNDILLQVSSITSGQYKELFKPVIPFFNNDSPIENQLWLLLSNNDKFNATGVMEVDLIVQHEAYVQHGLPATR